MNWMAVLKRIWPHKKAKEKENVLSIAQKCAPLIDELVLRIFKQHGRKIITSEALYVVPAVWGTQNGAALDRTQRQIQEDFLATYHRLREAMGIHGLNQAQEYALGYLIRDLVITKLVFMKEKAKNAPSRRTPAANPGLDLEHMEIIGSA